MTDELKDQRISVMLTTSELAEVDDWRFQRRLGSRGEAIRQLIRSGLEVQKDKQNQSSPQNVANPK